MDYPCIFDEIKAQHGLMVKETGSRNLPHSVSAILFVTKPHNPCPKGFIPALGWSHQRKIEFRTLLQLNGIETPKQSYPNAVNPLGIKERGIYRLRELEQKHRKN